MENFLSSMKKGLDCMMKFGEENEKSVQLFHHNDTDGVTSASILDITFRKLSFKIEKRVPLEKPYPEILDNIFSQEGKIIVFTDICGRIANIISKLNKSRNFIIILDHHVASKSEDPNVFNLDCDLFNIRGDLNMSASCICYEFSKVALGEEIAKPLSFIGTLGAVGDGLFVKDRLVYQNQKMYQDSLSLNAIKFDKERKCYINKHGMNLREIANSIDILGAIGYLENGGSIAVDYLIKNYLDGAPILTDESLILKIESLKSLKDKIFEDTFNHLDELTIKTKDASDEEIILMIDVEDRFRPMGVKMIGLFLHELAQKRRIVDKDRYLFGSQNIPETVPGFEGIKIKGMKKVSGRVSPELAEKIGHGYACPLDILMPNAARSVESGFSDACHSISAAIVVGGPDLVSFYNKACAIMKGGCGVGCGSGKGKTILCGGDCGFLMWGCEGIVGALPFETIALIEPIPKDELTEEARAKGWETLDKRPTVPGYKEHKFEKQDLSIKLQMEHMGLMDRLKKNPIRITLRGTLLAASGDGASAAHCVSLARACNQAFELGMTQHEINKAGWIGEHSFHGTPSGVDNTVSTFGGLINISFNPINKINKFHRVNVESVEIVLAHSGITADTSTLYPICKRLRSENQSFFDGKIEAIKSDIRKIEQYFENSDWENLGKMMIENHKKIQDLGLSHPKVDELCKLGIEAGALGAKVTGGGLGGYTLFLTPGKELQKKVKKTMENAGAKAIFAVKWPSLEGMVDIN